MIDDNQCSIGSLTVETTASIYDKSMAIERHMVEHKRKFGLSEKQAKTIPNHLIIQTFELASKSYAVFLPEVILTCQRLRELFK